MFKSSDKILPSNLTPFGKLKRKIWNISTLLLFASLFLIDVVNARTGSHLHEMLVLISNIPLIIPLMIPWGLAYLITTRHRDLLKIFAPLYISLILLVTTGSLAFHHFAQSQNLEEKFGQEMANLIKEQADFLGKMEASSQIQSRTYSADEYGLFAVYLNRFKKLMDLYKQENMALVQAFNEVELDKVFTEEVLFNFFNIVEKKKKLEKLSLFVDESAQRTEDIYSEYVTWVLSSPELDEMSRKNLTKAISTSPEQKKFFRQEPYRFKKNIVQEHIIFLDFLSKAYGNYGIGEDGRILFNNDKDLQTWNSHYETIENLFREEGNFFLFSQEKLAQAEKSLPTTTKMSDDSIQAAEEYDSNCLDPISEFCKQETISLRQALAEIDVNSICTKEVFLNLAKIVERKKKLEQMCVNLDENEKKWENQLPDLVQRALSSSQLNDQSRRKIEGFNKTIPSLEKQSFAIKKKYVLEFINLLNLLSIRYGTYNINDQGLCFSSQIESKLYESSLNNIRGLLQEEKDIDLLIERRMQELFK